MERDGSPKAEGNGLAASGVQNSKVEVGLSLTGPGLNSTVWAHFWERRRKRGKQ